MIPWLLALWIVAGAFVTSPPGNLREATNEAWLWVSGAAIFTAARRLTSRRQTQRAMLAVLALCALGQAVHGLHQQFISLPQDRADYLADPEEVLRKLDLDAPAGSAERMVLENRLFDGGPTGTFALANSLAAVLLIGVIVSAGVLRYSWAGSGVSGRAAWSALLIVCLVCLLAARSRSATLAVIVGIVLMFVLGSQSGRDKIGGTAALFVKGIIAIAVLGFITMMGLAAFGNAEWFAQAPASLEFRLQYWRATLAMAVDRPIFAAGPGNFQSIYLRYREPSANEQIAEPHNFLFETLASGGFAALVMLVVLMVCIVLYCRRQNASAISDEDARDSSALWLWIGVGVAFVLTWLIAAVTGRLPDWRANLFVVPIVLGIGWIAWPAVGLLSGRQLNVIASVALISLLVHLLAAGGWTIPGVALNVWLLAGLMTSVDRDPVSRPAPGWSVGSLALGLVLLATLRSMSLVPVQTAQLAIADARYWQNRGQLRQTQMSLEMAMDADRWSPAAAIWQADLSHWRLITEGDSAETRRSWKQFVALAIERGGEDPSLWEAIGHQQLHLYQRYGDAADLAAADETFTQMSAGIPGTRERWPSWRPSQTAGAINRGPPNLLSVLTIWPDWAIISRGTWSVS